MTPSRSDSPAVSASEAARILGVSRAGLAEKIGRHLHPVDGVTPLVIPVADVLAELRRMIHNAETRVQKLRDLGAAAGLTAVATAAPPPSAPAQDQGGAEVAGGGTDPQLLVSQWTGVLGSVGDRLVDAVEHVRIDMEEALRQSRDELASERTGRAVAETRIDALKAELRRANAAIDALKANPDLDVDRAEA